MADLENVVEHLYDCLAASKPENMWVFVRKDIVGDVIAILKEQEAKLVLNIADSIAGMEGGDCPRCGRYLANRISDPSKFCKYCGQAVKWE